MPIGALACRKRSAGSTPRTGAGAASRGPCEPVASHRAPSGAKRGRRAVEEFGRPRRSHKPKNAGSNPARATSEARNHPCALGRTWPSRQSGRLTWPLPPEEERLLIESMLSAPQCESGDPALVSRGVTGSTTDFGSVRQRSNRCGRAPGL